MSPSAKYALIGTSHATITQAGQRTWISRCNNSSKSTPASQDSASPAGPRASSAGIYNFQAIVYRF
ncbi:MAG TPA: hypothetical protein PK961_15240, partial [bacterium]|nr:hypothetical protein [bacterium]